jgi:hypothetical protein
MQLLSGRQVFGIAAKKERQMAATSRSRKKSSRKQAAPTRKVSRARSAPPDIGADEIKRMVKAPGDSERPL